MAVIKNPLTLVKQEGGGGGQTQGEYYALVYDYDGTVLKEQRLNSGDTFELPTPPIHSGLIFDDWSSSEALTATTVNGITKYTVTITDNNFMAGPLYYTESGKTEIYITVDKGSGLDFKVYFGSIPNDFVIDWGDGTSDDKNTLTNNTKHIHSYQNYGQYVIKINNTTSNALYGYAFDQYEDKNNAKMVDEIRFGKNLKTFNITYLSNLKKFTTYSGMNYVSAAFCTTLQSYIITNANAAINFETIRSCYCVKYMFFDYRNASGVSGQYTLSSNYSLKKLVLAKNTNIGNSGTAQISSTSLEELVIPSSMTLLMSKASGLSDNRNLRKVKFLQNNYESIPASFFNNCYTLKDVVLSDSLTSIPNGLFNYCYCLTNVEMPNQDLTLIGSSAFANTKLRYIIFKKNVAQIGSSAFDNLTNTLQYIDFTHCTSVPILDNANAVGGVSYAKATYKILVPASLYNDWIVATNWSNQYVVDRIIPVDNS